MWLSHVASGYLVKCESGEVAGNSAAYRHQHPAPANMRLMTLGGGRVGETNAVTTKDLNRAFEYGVGIYLKSTPYSPPYSVLLLRKVS